MRFSIATVIASIATFVLAQSGFNAFNVPTAGYLLNAGQPTTFTWDNKQGSTVTLTLRDGANGDLNSGTVIASHIQNSGSYTWDVPSSIVEGNSYTIEISDDDDPSQTNFTPQFDILSPNKATPTASGSSSAASTGSASSSAAVSSGASTSASASAASTSGASSSGAASSTSSSPASTTAAASTSSPTSDSANMLKVSGGSLLAVAFGFAVAL